MVNKMEKAGIQIKVERGKKEYGKPGKGLDGLRVRNTLLNLLIYIYDRSIA